MLANLEQTQTYNACNFMLGNNAPNSYGYYANSTVTNMRVSAFLCPSDPNAGVLQVIRPADGRMDTLDVSYVASAGTTTNSPNNKAPTYPWATQGSTGLFWWYISYGIQNITDGTSNTVAFSEALVSNGGRIKTRRQSRTPIPATRSRASRRRRRGPAVRCQPKLGRSFSRSGRLHHGVAQPAGIEQPAAVCSGRSAHSG